MAKIMSKLTQRDERGMALMMALFALLLLSGISLCMVLASTTETRIDANYGGSLRSYYAAHSGLEEMRDRISYLSTTTSSGLADKLPTDIAGNANGVLYVLNPDAGETVDPTDPASPYFDVQLCHDYNSGVTVRDSKCTAVPGTPNWMMASLYAAPSTAPAAVSLGYKWVRVNMKTNRIAAPYFVDQQGDPTTLDTRVCWDGKTEQLSPGGATPACDANGMLPVYMLTSLATAQGTRNLLRAEVVGSSIRPPGAITVEVGGSASTTPIPATFNVPTLSSATVFPLTSIDGRVHHADGSLATTLSCSNVAPVAANTPQGTASLQTGLNSLRSALVQAANNLCNADGSSISASNPCTAPLAWVRGTGALPRFTTSSASPTPTPTPAPSPTPSPTPVTSTSNSGSGSSGHDGHDNHNPTPTPTPIPTPTPTPVATADCSTATQSCYTNLDLSDNHLSPSPLFGGNPGNSVDPAVYQSQTPNIVADENQAVLDYIAARRASGKNYFEVASTSLAATYGSLTQPAVVVITDSSLKLLNTSLTGVGILQVPSDFEIQSSNLQWTGIVMVRSSSTSPSGQFFVNTGATGMINGALMLQAGDQFFLTTSSSGAGNFTISYSCEAIDAAMGNPPLKVVSHTETSY
ncbi:MAG: hypothetical protein LAO76_04505 [Acidobacteriia bacterium]|nr:hypothetical protein [Terriglobia bacterium]